MKRRDFLTRIGAGAALSPFIPILEAEAQSATPPPTRLIIVHSPNGVVSMDRWRPSGSETSFTMRECLAPLETVKNDLIVLEGIEDRAGNWGHTGPQACLLSGVAARFIAGPDDYVGRGITVDQHIGNAIGAATRFPSLQFGVTATAEYSTQGPHGHLLSYAGPEQGVAAESNPYAAFKRLFAQPPSDARRRDQLSVLDFVKGDLTRVRSRVGSADAIKIDRHVEHVRAIERTLTQSLQQTCASLNQGNAVDWLDMKNIPIILKLQIDLLVAAIACDRTRVATLQIGVTGWKAIFSWLGHYASNHDLNHLPLYDATVQANQWIAQHGVAYLIGQLKSVTETDGKPLLHHCAGVWLNELSAGDVHSNDPIPAVLFGQASGRWRTGRYLQLASRQPHNNLLVSLCQAMGLPTATFGDPAHCTGPVTI